jgi:hypothetical protein
VVVGVGAGLAVVEVGWWDPFGLAVGVFAGGPALVGHCVVGVAAEGEGVDVGDGVGGVGVAVVDLAQIARHGAAGEGAATVLGTTVQVRYRVYGVYDKYRPNPEMHRKRMAELAEERGKKFVRILPKEGDTRFLGSEYAIFRWQSPELFSPTMLYTFGDYLRLISFYHRPAPHIILIHSKTYADAYKLASGASWRNAKEPQHVRAKD